MSVALVEPRVSWGQEIFLFGLTKTKFYQNNCVFQYMLQVLSIPNTARLCERPKHYKQVTLISSFS